MAQDFKLDQCAPIATIGDLAGYDAVIVGVPTRFGRSQMASFLSCFDALLPRRSPPPGRLGIQQR